MLAQTALDCRPKRHSSRVTLFGAEEGGAGSGHAQAYQDRAVRPSHSPDPIEECLDRILAMTAAIEDHFEQSSGSWSFRRS
jgi:hypothetical protein